MGISNTSVRQWGAQYADYMSPTANPGPGKERKYTEDDIATLRTIAVLRSQFATQTTIIEALERGDVLEPVDIPADDSKAQQPDSRPPGGDAFIKALTAYETQVTRLQQDNKELHERLLEATNRATRAETLLERTNVPATENNAAQTIVASDDSAGELSLRQRFGRWIAGG